MNLHLQLPIVDIERKINASLQDILYKGNIGEYEDIQIVVQKRGNLRLKAELNMIFAEAPLRVEVKIGKETLRTFFKGIVKTIEEIDLDLAVQYDIRPDVSVQWKAVPRIQGRCLWEKEPILELLGSKFNLSSTLQWVIDDQIKKIAKWIEKYLREDIRIEQYVLMAWNIIQTPIKINDEYKVWLNINPQQKELYATPIQCNGGFLKATVGVQMFPECVIGEEPPKNALKPLPNFEPVAKLSEYSQLLLTAETPFNNLQKLIENQTFTLTHEWVKSVAIRTFKLREERHNAVVDLSLTVDLKVLGAMYIEAEVKLDIVRDETTLKAKLSPFEMRLTGGSTAARSYFLFNGASLTKAVKNSLEAVIDAQLVNLTKLIQKALNKNQVQKYVLLEGNLKSVSLKEGQVLTDRLKLVLEAEGKVTIEIGNF
jgi:hypothetical protein